MSACQYVPDEGTHLINSSSDHMCVQWDITPGLRASVLRGEFQSRHVVGMLSVSFSGSNSRMFESGSRDANACSPIFLHA